MDKHLYLLANRVEALVASMLPPEEFGTYMATGTKKLSHDKLLFLEVAPDLKSDYFDLSLVAKQCVAHADGTPKHSVYISIYRVLEHLDLAAIGDLYCVTRDGRVLRLQAREYDQPEAPGARLYQELCPVPPLIASNLAPKAFCRFVTDRSRPVSVPKIFFADLIIADAGGELLGASLPYRNPEHLRSCLQGLDHGTKHTKTVDRAHSDEFFYRTIRDGFFLGAGDQVKWYPFPTREQFQDEYHTWWRSATMG